MRWGRLCRNGKKSASRLVPDVNLESSSAPNSPGSFAFLWQAAKDQREREREREKENENQVWQRTFKFLTRPRKIQREHKRTSKASAEIMQKDQKG